MAKKPPSITAEKAATPAEVRTALGELTTAQLLRLERYGQFRIAGLGRRAKGRDHKDLLSDAVFATLEGTRKWNKDAIPIDLHLRGAMRSISSHWREQFDDDSEPQLESDVIRTNQEGDEVNPLEKVSLYAPDAYRETVARAHVERIERRFAKDLQVLLILEGMRDGKSAREIQAMGLTVNEYAAAVKRLRRNCI